MPSVRTVVSIENQVFVVTDAEKAFGDMPRDYKDTLILGTADDIATLTLMDEFGGVIVPRGATTETRIEERKKGLVALGVTDVGAQISEALARLRQADMKEKVRRAANFMAQ